MTSNCLKALAAIAAMSALATWGSPSASAQPPAQTPTLGRGAGRGGHAAKRPGMADRQDKLVTNFEAMFGRKLSADQTAQLQQAEHDRAAALKAAQDTWRQQYLKITGVTEDELKAKEKELRQQQRAARQARTATATNATVPTTGATTGTTAAAPVR